MNEYAKERFEQLRITDENNLIKLDVSDEGSTKPQWQNDKIFTVTENGDIEILHYSLSRRYFTYSVPGVHGAGPRTKYDVLTRLSPEREKQYGRKYHISGKTGIHPFFPPNLVQAFDDEKEIPVLIITEGFFKAWYASLFGAYVVGLSSITHYRDSKTREFHPEILQIIDKCKVKSVILLYDGDCFNVSDKQLQAGEDLYKRPGGFFESAKAIKDLLQETINRKNITLYFGHVNSAELEARPKGLDDVLQQFEGQEATVIEDLENVSRQRGSFFGKTNITDTLKKLKSYLHLKSAKEFYEFHEEIINTREFVFLGTKYKKNTDGELEVMQPAEAKSYFRVGDHFYKKIQVPNKFNDLESIYVRRGKETITLDHGKTFIKHIDTFEAFCNVPDHINHQEIQHGCYNTYAPFEHEPVEGSCEHTLAFIKHIFQEHYELGLDYVQLLYQRPQNVLPVLCLVSRENQTGKSTFMRWLKMIFTQNAAYVGNDDLGNPFNSHWSNKLLVMCEETFVEKQAITEKIKNLSTSDKITVNAKGRDQYEIDFFGKFILAGNNEDNFIRANEYDIRYWVRKVPVIEKVDPNLNEYLREEIPAFLYMLSNRQMHTSGKGSRMWFSENEILTDALKKLRASSAPSVLREIKENIRAMFIEFGIDEIRLCPKDISVEFLKNKVEQNYIRDVLREKMKLDIDKVQRYRYPYWKPDFKEGDDSIMMGYKNRVGRPFIFLRKDFLTAEEMETIKYDPALYIHTKGSADPEPAAADVELPF